MGIDPEDDRPWKTEKQQEWADWAASGYAKRFQPRSIRRFGLAFTFVMIAGSLPSSGSPPTDGSLGSDHEPANLEGAALVSRAPVREVGPTA